MILASILLLLGLAEPQMPVVCPDGPEMGQGSEPSLVLFEDGKPQFFLCSDQIGTDPLGEVVGYRVGDPQPVVVCEFPFDCQVVVGDETAEVTALDSFPTGPDWSYVDTPVWRWSLSAGPKPQVVKTLVLSPPRLSPEEIQQALDFFEQALGHDSPFDDVEYRLLVAALNGDESARQAFADLPQLTTLDGIYGELYSHCSDLYAEYAKLHGLPPLH